MLLKLQSAISLFTCGCLVSVAASPSSIGFVVTSGQVQVDEPSSTATRRYFREMSYRPATRLLI